MKIHNLDSSEALQFNMLINNMCWSINSISDRAQMHSRHPKQLNCFLSFNRNCTGEESQFVRQVALLHY